MKRFLSLLQAFWFTLRHPLTITYLTIVRRYVDAQGNYIGELYEGEGRVAKMIGASCDNMPLNVDWRKLPMYPRMCYSKSFLEPLPQHTLRVGAIEPQDNNRIQAYIACRRFLPFRLEVRNRFVEYVLERKEIA